LTEASFEASRAKPRKIEFEGEGEGDFEGEFEFEGAAIPPLNKFYLATAADR
jgi:hypothetical protein